MKAWLFALIAGRRPQLVTVPFTANGVLVVPASVNALDMTGFGARGANGTTSRVNQYTRNITYYGVRKSDGVTEIDFIQYARETSGVNPVFAYCDPPLATGPGSEYSSTQACYDNFVDTSYDFTSPPTRGASATGVGKTFPGSLGNVAQTPTVFTNVAVTPGASYNIVVPTGGSVTISYYV